MVDCQECVPVNNVLTIICVSYSTYCGLTVVSCYSILGFTYPKETILPKEKKQEKFTNTCSY